MRNTYFVPLILLLGTAVILGRSEVYIVMLQGDPVVSYKGGVDGFQATAVDSDSDAKIDATSENVVSYASHLSRTHDTLLETLFDSGTFTKLYSYTHLINGVAVNISAEQAYALKRAPWVKSVEKDWKVTKLTTHTPEFLGLPTGVWNTKAGTHFDGEGVVIGFVDTGINPNHPSFEFSPNLGEKLSRFNGTCELEAGTNRSFCNGKIVGAQHFAKAAKAAGAFNKSIHDDSPLDEDGHGSHTAATAAGNSNISAVIYGHEFGRASGMAPRARIAVYKALYRKIGGYVVDVVAAIDAAVHDGVDILNLSVASKAPPPSDIAKATFLNAFDITLLSAVKAGIFVAQAAGNGGPDPRTMLSYSPWIMSVAAGVDDRRYKQHLTLGNGKILDGLGLSPATSPNKTYALVAATDVSLDPSKGKLSNTTECQHPELLNKALVQGSILICGYSFGFTISGTASIRGVAETAKKLDAVGFVLVVEDSSPGSRYSPVPSGQPGILVTEPTMSKALVDYYQNYTVRDNITGRVTKFSAVGSIGDGLNPTFVSSAPQVAFFSARGPNIRNYEYEEADLLKPDILAPGSQIWAAWSKTGTDEVNYAGQSFAIVSGTSMAAPHIAGIAALVKQKHPDWSPAAIKSALMTTSETVNREGGPLQAEQYYSETEALSIGKATPFDYGSGFVNAASALDPGLVFDAGFMEYVGFLCSTPGINSSEIEKYTNTLCKDTLLGLHPADFNSPSIAISGLVGNRTVTRTVTNVAAEEEKYTITAMMGEGVAIRVEPTAMTLSPGASLKFSVTLTAKNVTGAYSFGEVSLQGSRGHRARILVAAMCKN